MVVDWLVKCSTDPLWQVCGLFLCQEVTRSGWTDHPTKILSKNQVMYCFEIVAARALVQAIIHVYYTVDKNVN